MSCTCRIYRQNSRAQRQAFVLELFIVPATKKSTYSRASLQPLATSSPILHYECSPIWLSHATLEVVSFLFSTARLFIYYNRDLKSKFITVVDVDVVLILGALVPSGGVCPLFLHLSELVSSLAL